jgi:Asp-tRNA(Asn)/Glu-tRNA(Gln) amidotransferase A subunit family amidase
MNEGSLMASTVSGPPMADLCRLSASELAAGLRRRELKAIDVTEACLARIAEREPVLHAWACFDADYAGRQARDLDAGPIRGPLHGLPIGVKDIFDTAELPTEYGSPIYRGHRPAGDAACVALARAAGAVVLGKTASTEFAVYSSTATVNPHNAVHTPGGSSSGSAAAVADAMAPLAFGTQTAGSIIRPASFCGIVGYKPTHGTIGRAGVKLLAESLDTVGVFARSATDAALFVGALTARDDLLELPDMSGPLRIGLCRTHEWSHLEADAAAALEESARRLAASGAVLRSVDLPDDFAELGDAHTAIFGYEAARNLAHERRLYEEQLTPRLRKELEAGEGVTAPRYDAAQRLARDCRRRLPSVMADCDVLIAPSATGEAPKGLESTGGPVMNRVWTLLQVPCVNVPCGQGSRGLPLGLQVIGRCGDDARTLAAATRIGERLGA